MQIHQFFVFMYAFGRTSGTDWDVCKVSFASNLSAKFCKPDGMQHASLSAKFCKPDGMQHASLLTCHGIIACGAVQ